MKRSRSSFLALTVLVALLPACGGAPREPAAPPPSDRAAEPAGGGAAGTSADGPETSPPHAAPREDPSIPTPPPLTPLGVPECDKFVDKYVACVDLRAPADQKERLMQELHVHRARWRALQKIQDGRLAAALSCRGVAQRLKGDLIVDYGCDF